VLVAGVAIAVAVVGACVTTPTAEAPRINVVVDDAGGAGADCDARVVPVRGPRPEGTRVIATVTVTADRPVALESLEQAALVPALRRCSGGLAVLRVEAADGTDGYLSATAEAWTAAAQGLPPAAAP
jgi:hypothetical protein